MKMQRLKTSFSTYYPVVLFILLSFFLNSCKKDTIPVEPSSSETKILSTKENRNKFTSLAKSDIGFLKQWYEASSKAQHSLSSLVPDWDNVAYADGEEYFIYEVDLFNPKDIFTTTEAADANLVKTRPLNTFRLLIYQKKTNNELSGGYLSIAPEDKVSNPKSIHFGNFAEFSGKVSLYNMSGKFVKGLVYKSGEVKKSIGYKKEMPDAKTINSLYTKASQSSLKKSNPIGVMVAENCNYELEPVNGLACVQAGTGQTVCTPYVMYYDIVYYCDDVESIRPTDLEDLYGGAPSLPADLLPEFPDLPGDKTSIDPQKFIDCFNSINNTNATYKVIVQVQEPVPGTSQAWSWTNSVGHTAITISKTGSNGTVTQTVGFYPILKTASFGGASKLVDNGADIEFTISKEFTGISATNFNYMLGMIASPPTNYNLFNNNCTDFVLNICAVGGLSLPAADAHYSMLGAPNNQIVANTPGMLGLNLRTEKANGDNRVKTNKSAAPSSHGPCN